MVAVRSPQASLKVSWTVKLSVAENSSNENFCLPGDEQKFLNVIGERLKLHGGF